MAMGHIGPAPRREDPCQMKLVRNDRNGAGLEAVTGEHHALRPSPYRWADRGRAAVGWIALDGSA